MLYTHNIRIFIMYIIKLVNFNAAVHTWSGYGTTTVNFDSGDVQKRGLRFDQIIAKQKKYTSKSSEALRFWTQLSWLW